MQISVEAVDGHARAGVLHTARGAVQTPVFMPVGTRAAVRTLVAEDLEALGAHVVLANTYHLMLRPGADIVAEAGGLHAFTGWSGGILTDSGGYQVFSLSPVVDEDGVTFPSTYDGSRHRLTPEDAAAIQARLGADIQMALDICPALPAAAETVLDATERTHRWAARARAAFLDGARPEGQAQFGIVQGGVDLALRAASAAEIVSIGFDGYAIGGLSVGESRAELVEAAAAATANLPGDQPRYLMGVGDPAGIAEAVGLGIDMFDCVLPTRLARHGTILTTTGKVNLRNARYARDFGPLDPDNPCPLVARYSRAYVRHLFAARELTALRIATVHNLWWLFDLVRRLRRAVAEGRYQAERRAVLEVWADA